jgi:hypothetical protein
MERGLYWNHLGVPTIPQALAGHVTELRSRFFEHHAAIH